MAVFLARMVMPRSRSSSFESITRSATDSLARNVPLCFSMASTRVVLPWSTCAMMAMLRILKLKVGCVLYLTDRVDEHSLPLGRWLPVYNFTMGGAFSGDYIALTCCWPTTQPERKWMGCLRFAFVLPTLPQLPRFQRQRLLRLRPACGGGTKAQSRLVKTRRLSWIPH